MGTDTVLKRNNYRTCHHHSKCS